MEYLLTLLSVGIAHICVVHRPWSVPGKSYFCCHLKTFSFPLKAGLTKRKDASIVVNKEGDSKGSLGHLS